MPLRRGHVYGIRTSLPEFVNACLGLGQQTGQLVSSAIRPCVLVSSNGGACQIALLATYNNSPQAQITDPTLHHFSIPTSELQPRHGLTTVDHNRQSTSERRIQHQYVVALFGSVHPTQLVEWTDGDTQSSIHFSESAMRRLEAFATQRMQMWMQMQSGFAPSPGQSPAPLPTYYSSVSSCTDQSTQNSTFRAPWP